MTRKLLTTALAVLAALALVACGDKDSSSTTSTTATPKVTATGAWTRVTAPEQMNGAVYVTLRSTTGDMLMGASVPASVAKEASLHKTTTSMDSGSDGGMSSMKPVANIALPAGEAVVLKPGGLHVMLMGLEAPLTAGTKVPVTLKFQNAGTVTVDAVAREN